MTRERLARMDVDTGWVYHRKFRALRLRYPERWAGYAAAYFALLGEAWANGDRRLTLEETFPQSMPCTVEEAAAALEAVRIIDTAHRIPLRSWREWYEPVAARVAQKSTAGALGAAKRWGSTRGNSGANGGAMADPMHHPSQPSMPSKPAKPARTREPRGSAKGPTRAQAERAWAELGEQFGSPKVSGDPL